MAKVSIVIPTRNRGHLLHYALRSVIQQTYKNLEIVVCDNFSVDNTREIVDSFNNKDIIYMRTDTVLSMPDNWEFALSRATGEYVAYLTDDSYLLPDSISKAMKDLDRFNVKVVVWKHCAYFASDWLESARRNILYFPKVTFKSYLMNSKASLRKLYDLDGSISTMVPKSLNSLCHRSIMEKAAGVQHRFFLPSCPDYTSAASILLNVPEYLLIDQPLYVDGVTTSSIGATTSFNLGESTQKCISEFSGKIDDIVCFGIPTSPTAIAKSLELVRSFYMDICPKVNMKALLCATVDRLLKLKSNGVGVDDYMKILHDNIAIQPGHVQLAIALQKVISKFKWMIIKKLRSSPRLEYLETLRNIAIFRGSDWSFNNIEESARIVVQRMSNAR